MDCVYKYILIYVFISCSNRVIYLVEVCIIFVVGHTQYDIFVTQTHTYSPTLSFFFSHTHIHTALSMCHTNAHLLTHTLSLSLTHTYTHSLVYVSHTHRPTHTHSLSFSRIRIYTQTHTRTHTQTLKSPRIICVAGHPQYWLYGDPGRVSC